MRAGLSARARAALAAGRAAGWASRASGRGAGAQISGRVMLELDRDLLVELGAGRRITLVSATNGKTTTTSFLTAALQAGGEHVVSNATGANLASGMASALARSQSGDRVVLEVDERVLSTVVDALDPELLVFGNLSRDQLDRFGEVRSATQRWRTICEGTPERAVVANASDPQVAWAASPGTVTWVELGANWRQDSATCPHCGALLDWDTRYRCPQCEFAQPETTNRLAGDALLLGGVRIPIELSLPGEWNVANAALAITAAVQLGVDPTTAAAALTSIDSVSGRYRTHRLSDGRTLRILLAKNPAGWHEVLRFLAERDTGVVIALNAHVADGRDPSWLYDVPFETLEGHSVAATGERMLDVAVRLDYAGLDPVVEADPMTAAIRVAGDDVHVVASYTQFTALTKRLG